MRVIQPSAEIQDRRSLSPSQKIESFGRVSYKSEGKTEPGSDEIFCKKMADHGHWPVFEGACIHLLIIAEDEDIEDFRRITDVKYFNVAYRPGKVYLSGTVRAFKEGIRPLLTTIHREVADFLANKYPILFDTHFPIEDGSPRYCGITEKTPTDIKNSLGVLADEHLMVMVKFIVNRAVSHELVRHRPASFLQESQRYCRYGEKKFGNEITVIKPCFYKEETPEYNIWFFSMLCAEESYMELLNTSSPQAARTVLPNSCKTELYVYATVKEWLHIFSLRNSNFAEPSMREVIKPLADSFWMNIHLAE